MVKSKSVTVLNNHDHSIDSVVGSFLLLDVGEIQDRICSGELVFEPGYIKDESGKVELLEISLVASKKSLKK